MGAKKQRRIRSPHPGVILLAPRGARRSWRACWVDPDSGKETYEKLPKTITTIEQRRAWAIDKAKELNKRRVELEAGAVRASGRTLSAALKDYFEQNPHLRARTLYINQVASDKLEAFAAKEGVTSCDEVNRPLLKRFRAHLIKEPKKRAKAGGKRGEFAAGDEPRSVVSVNQDIVAAKAVLNYLCELEVFARLNPLDLKLALKEVEEPEKHIEFHKPDEIKRLIEAALDHDAETFTLTRDEAAGKGEPGTTPKYPAVAPFTAFVLLSGCRKSEALDVDWSMIDLDASDNHGKKAGEMKIEGTGTKTRKKRTVGLEVSPALRALLVAMHAAAGKPKAGRVFDFTIESADAAVDRLKADYKAPADFTWQVLRATCGTFLTNAPGIFEAASVYRSAKQLGHSVAVAEESYVGLIRGISPKAKTLEAAMGIQALMKKVIKGRLS